MKATKEQKRREAEERNAAWAVLTFEQQLESLDRAFGVGKGATKQRAKIAKKIELRDTQPEPKKSKKNSKDNAKKAA